MLWQIITIVCINIIVYAHTLNLGYVSDDVAGLNRKFKSRRERFLFCLSSVPTGNKRIDHGLNILAHTLVCVMMYLALGQNEGSFMAALLFSVNPTNNQGSVWISGRHYAWCAFFVLLALFCPVAAFPAILMATVNPVGYFAPIALFARNLPYFGIVVLLVWIFRWKRLFSEVKTRRKFEAVAHDKMLNIKKIVVAIKIYGYYFALCLVPFNLAWYQSFMQSGAGGGNPEMNKKAFKLDWTFFLGMALIVYMLYSIFNWTEASWGIFWFMVCTAPYLNLFRMQQEIATRYIYIGNIGIMYALAQFLDPMSLCFFMTMYATRLLTFYPKAYKDDYFLIEHSVVEDSKAWYCWFTRGHKRWSQGSHRETLNMWVMAKMISPHEFKVLFNIAVVLKMLGKNSESEAYLKLAEINIIKGQEEQSLKLIDDARKASKVGEFPMIY